MTLLVLLGGLEPGAAQRSCTVDLAAPPHVPDHIFAHALHVLVGCKETGIIGIGSSSRGLPGCCLYLAGSTEWRMLVFDTGLSVAAWRTRDEGRKGKERGTSGADRR